jgi:hypothetical protein
VALVVLAPGTTPSMTTVLAVSFGNPGWSDTSKRYVTVPTAPVAAALLTTSIGRVVATV